MEEGLLSETGSYCVKLASNDSPASISGALRRQESQSPDPLLSSFNCMCIAYILQKRNREMKSLASGHTSLKQSRASNPSRAE